MSSEEIRVRLQHALRHVQHLRRHDPRDQADHLESDLRPVELELAYIVRELEEETDCAISA